MKYIYKEKKIFDAVVDKFEKTKTSGKIENFAFLSFTGS